MIHNVPATVGVVLNAIEEYYGKEWLLHYLKAGGWKVVSNTDLHEIIIDGNTIHVYPIDGGVITSIYPALGPIRKGLKESCTTVIHYIHELYLIKIALNETKLINKAGTIIEPEN